MKLYIEKNKLNDIEFIEWINHDELPIYLNKLNLLVIPSYTEGLPNIMIEAMACGTPVLATPVGSIPDFIKDGNTGFLMENNSPECISENIIRAINYSDINSISENGHSMVKQEFSKENTIKKWLQLFSEI
jgi:glycosyltransferase involved in cell wall biosynthesis